MDNLRIHLHRPTSLTAIFLENLERMGEPFEEVDEPLRADIIVVSSNLYVGEVYRRTAFFAVVGSNPIGHVPENVSFLTTFESCQKFVEVVKSLLAQQLQAC